MAATDASGGWSWPWQKKSAAASNTSQRLSYTATLLGVLGIKGEEGVAKALQGTWATEGSSPCAQPPFTITNGCIYITDGANTGGTDHALDLAQVSMEQSTAERLVWKDGDVWVRRDAAEAAAAAKASTTSAAAAAAGSEPHTLSQALSALSGMGGDTPYALTVSCYDRHEIDGVYTRVDGAVVAGQPVWSCRRRRLFSTLSGHWMFGTAAKAGEDIGVVSSAAAHQGTLPHNIIDWDVHEEVGQGGMREEVDQWRRCTLMSVTVASQEVINDAASSVVTARRPMHGTVRVKPQRGTSELHCRTDNGGTEYNPDGGVAAWSQDAAQLRLELFCHLEEVSPTPPIETLHRMAKLVADGQTSLVQLLAGLCKRYGKQPPPTWTVASETIERTFELYALRAFFLTHDAPRVDSATSLQEDIELGRYSYDFVMKKLCVRYAAYACDVEDWTGEYPAGLREGFTGPDDGGSSNGGGSRHVPPANLQYVHIQKKPEDALQISWRDHVYLSTVAPGGLGDQHGLAKFIGCRCHSVNGTAVAVWQELIAATKDVADLTFAFDVKRDGDALPKVLRKIVVADPPKPRGGRRASIGEATVVEEADDPLANTLSVLQRQFTAGDLRAVSEVQQKLSASKRTMSVAQLSALVSTPSLYGMSRHESLRMAKHLYPQGSDMLDFLESEHTGRLAVAQEFRDSVVKNVLPRFSAITFGVIAHTYRKWLAAAKLLEQQKTAPRGALIAGYNGATARLEKVVQTGRTMRRLFKELPRPMAQLLERAQTALQDARMHDAAARQAEAVYHQHRARVQQAEVQLGAARAAGRPTDVLQQELADGLERGRDLNRAMFAAYGRSCLHAWRCAAPDAAVAPGAGAGGLLGVPAAGEAGSSEALESPEMPRDENSPGPSAEGHDFSPDLSPGKKSGPNPLEQMKSFSLIGKIEEGSAPTEEAADAVENTDDQSTTDGQAAFPSRRVRSRIKDVVKGAGGNIETPPATPPIPTEVEAAPAGKPQPPTHSDPFDEDDEGLVADRAT